MVTDAFFDESREQSQVKAEIVEKYFDAWAGIISGTQDRVRPAAVPKIAYVDLFAGPGRYKDGATSTPLRVLAKAVTKSTYADRLVTVFNDKDPANVSTLRAEITALPGIDRLKYAPQVWNEEVGDNIATRFTMMRDVPTLAFVDPWGYKGLTLRLVDSFLKNWGCDCLFFFNYGRINAGLSNPLVREHMNALFGEARAAALASALVELSPTEREATIVEQLASALQEYGHRYVLPFCFKNDQGTRTKHHLILVTKHFKGYDVMKQIMATSSSLQQQGVASFTYCPADRAQPLLFELNRPLDDLRGLLLEAFAGRSLSMRALYEEHSVGRPFLASHYKSVLRKLEDDGVVITHNRKSTRGFADDLRVSFPTRNG